MGRLTILHPSIERFFYDEAGQLNIQNTSLMGTGMFLLIVTIIVLCCWKITCFREGIFSIIKKTPSTLYELCTTEQFRLKKEKDQLKKKIDKSFTELEEMEDLIRKKKEIHRKLPKAQSKQPSAPPAEIQEKTPGKPKVQPTRTTVEVHEARYSVNPRKS